MPPKLTKLDILTSNRLIARSLRGGAVLSFGTFLERGVRFLRNIALTRLLAPNQFGLMALVIASNGLFEVLTEVGIRWAVIQNKKGDTPEFLNAAFWFGAVRGTGLYLIGFFATPFIASFYQEPALNSFLKISFLAILLNGFTNPGIYVLEKKLRFLPQVAVIQGAGLMGTAVSLVLAIFYPNVWALIIGFVCEACFRCAGSNVVSSFRPSWRVDPQARKDLFQFSRGILGMPLLTYLFMQADIFVLGKFCTKDMLGLYAMALSLASMPQMCFSRIAGKLVLPVFSEMQDRRDRLAGNLLRMNRLIFVFGLPATVVASIFAAPILEITYGPKYVPVAGAFSFLNFYYLIYMSNAIITSAYLALGRPDLQRLFTLVRLLILMVGLVPMVYYFEAAGAAAMRVLCMLLAGIVQFYNFSSLLHITKWRYLNSIKEGLILAAVIAVPALIIRNTVQGSLVLLIFAGLLWGIIGGAGLWILKSSFSRFTVGAETPSVS